MQGVIIAIIASGTLSAVISSAMTAWRERRKRETGIEAGVRIILYDRIKHLGKKYIESGYICPDDLEDIIEMHRIYHDSLRGNGFLNSVMQKVTSLPIITKGESI